MSVAAMEEHYEVVVIGAGPAGCATAAVLAKAGCRVALLDRDRFPRDKLCGEFLSGESQALLKSIGCLDEVLGHGPAEISHMRFFANRGATLDVCLPSPALGLSRRKLDFTLLQHAERCGASVFQGVEVRSIEGAAGIGTEATLQVAEAGGEGGHVAGVRAPVVVAAYGRQSHLDRALGRVGAGARLPYMGFKLHHRPLHTGEYGTLDAAGEMHAFDGGYCGICRIEGGLVNVCMLLHQRVMKQIGSAAWPAVIAWLSSQNAEFSRSMDKLQRIDEPVQTVARVSFEKKVLVSGRVFHVGDAAAMIAPMCGDGQAMALESGKLLADCILEERTRGKDAPVNLQRLAGRWRRAWDASYRMRVIVGRVLQSGLIRPAIANTAIRALDFMPRGAVDYLARVTRG